MLRFSHFVCAVYDHASGILVVVAQFTSTSLVMSSEKAIVAATHHNCCLFTFLCKSAFTYLTYFQNKSIYFF